MSMKCQMYTLLLVSPLCNSLNFYEKNLDKIYHIMQNHAEDYEFALFASIGSCFFWNSNSKCHLDIRFVVQ